MSKVSEFTLAAFLYFAASGVQTTVVAVSTNEVTRWIAAFSNFVLFVIWLAYLLNYTKD